MAPSTGLMITAVLFVLVSHAAASASIQIVGGQHRDGGDAGSFDIVVDGQVWLRSATPSLKVDNVHSPLSLLRR